MSQSELERRCGIPKTTLSRYENGHVEPSLSTLLKLASALNVSAARLLPDTCPHENDFIDALREHGVRIDSPEQVQHLVELVLASDRLREQHS